jgi:uncharacterized protein
MSLRERVLAHLRAAVPQGTLAVAFSAGVDSTLLLALACEALGPERVLAVTADSESLARAELEACQALTARLGVTLEVLRTRELDRDGYVANAGDRCYHCKTELFERLERDVLGRPEVSAAAYGATADDLGDHRPGMRAAREHRVLAPLQDCGLAKADVRALSRELGLPTWDKPAHPCLASRIPYGQQVTSAKLAQVEAAEAALRELGFVELRVRHHAQSLGGPLARIEVPLSDLPRIIEPETRARINAALRAQGFAFVVLDLEGFRSGRLNDALSAAPRLLPVTGP